MSEKTFTIRYMTGNSDRCIGAVNGARNDDEAIELFAEANGLKLGFARGKGRATIKGRSGTVYAMAERGEIKPGEMTINRHKYDERQVMKAKIMGATQEIWPLPNSTFTLLPVPILDLDEDEGMTKDRRVVIEMNDGMIIDYAADPGVQLVILDFGASELAEEKTIVVDDIEVCVEWRDGEDFARDQDRCLPYLDKIDAALLNMKIPGEEEK